MNEVKDNNKRIAKNTLMLYIRMGFVMIANLFVVRIVLNAIGETDYGIYNVVGGIVIMFSFLGRVLASSSQRYFAFDLGKNDKEHLKKTFSITVLLYIVACIIILILAETVGLWFLETELTIPTDREYAAIWVYQFSIISFIFGLITTPYQAMIIAKERMHIYAYLGVLEAVLNILLAGLLTILPRRNDLLIIYGAGMAINTVLINSVYYLYNKLNIPESKLRLYWEKDLALEIVSYSWWNLFGSFAGVIRSQGINILINMFFNPVINAARALAYQINSALNSFASNFYTAVRPQITKYYAHGDIIECLNLVFKSSKYTYYLLLFVSIPVISYSNEILHLWLLEVPEYSPLFVRLVIITALIDSISNPLMSLAQATGNIKIYQVIIGSILILNLPFSWILLKLGFSPESTLYVAISVSLLALIARVIILKHIVEFPVKVYLTSVISSILITTFLSIVLTYIIHTTFAKMSGGIFSTIFQIGASTILTCIVIFLLGISKSERGPIISLIKSKFLRK